MKNIELAVFDIEGTISDKVQIPKDVILGFESLHRRGVKTTVVTGTGFIRVKELLGDYMDLIVSPNVPIGVENGGKLVSKTGETVAHYPLDESEIVDFLVFSHTLNPQYIVHYPNTRTERVQLWVPNQSEVEPLRVKHAQVADAYTSDRSSLQNKIIEDNPSIIIARASDAEKNTLVPARFNTVVNEGSIHLNANGINKGSALLEIARLSNVDIGRVLAAGNYLNDLPMFEQPVGERVLVGDLDISTYPYGAHVQRVASIEDLGRFLQKWPKE